MCPNLTKDDMNGTCDMAPLPNPTLLGARADRTDENRQQKSSRTKKGKNRVLCANHRRRHFVKHDYHDHANDREYEYGVENCRECTRIDGSSRDQAREVMASVIPSRTSCKARGGVTVPFPLKLHKMLEGAASEGLCSIVSWQPHGRAFLVHRPKEFIEEVMPKYFKQSKITSFQRQLNLYGFCRITKGPDAGAYYHELFLRGKPFLCNKMVRTKIKGTGSKAASSPATEPNFYQMPKLESACTPLPGKEVSGEIRTKLDQERSKLDEANSRLYVRTPAIIPISPSGSQEGRRLYGKGCCMDAIEPIPVSIDSLGPIPVSIDALEPIPVRHTSDAIELIPVRDSLNTIEPIQVKCSMEAAEPIPVTSLGATEPVFIGREGTEAKRSTKAISRDEKMRSASTKSFEGQRFHYMDSYDLPTKQHMFFSSAVPTSLSDDKDDILLPDDISFDADGFDALDVKNDHDLGQMLEILCD